MQRAKGKDESSELIRSPDGFLASSELLVPAPNDANQGGLLAGHTSCLVAGEGYYYVFF